MTTTRDAKGRITPKAKTPKTTEKTPRKSAPKSKTKTTPKAATPEVTPEPETIDVRDTMSARIVSIDGVPTGQPWPIQSSAFDHEAARNLRATNEATIPLPPDDEIMATDVAMLMSVIWKRHRAAGGDAGNQPDIINQFNNWKKAGRIMAGKTTATTNGHRALQENAASDATITKLVRAELKADPDFVAWSRIVRAIRADGEAVSRPRVEAILDIERAALPKTAKKAAPATKAKAKTNGAAKANPTGKAARKATTKAARAAKESSPVKATAKRSTKPAPRRAVKTVKRGR